MTDDLYQEVVPGDFIYNEGHVGVVFGQTPSGEIRYLYGRRRFLQTMKGRARRGYTELLKTYSRANHYNFKITEDQLRHYLLGPHTQHTPLGIEFNNQIIEKLLESQQEILRN